MLASAIGSLLMGKSLRPRQDYALRSHTQVGLRGCIGCDDWKQLRRHCIVVWLELLLSGHDFCVEVILDGALVDRDGVAPAHAPSITNLIHSPQDCGPEGTFLTEKDCN
jgi:hypothetical protein